ncbi:MAG: TSCPD domain-containing protein, partial [Eggerthellaceae bacterium]|nr:TSCPD domain-containing protein [Eggerthellaceae bacterium]
CNGNLKAIAKLVEGQPADKVADLLEGNTCGARPTSCADQLAKALRDERRRCPACARPEPGQRRRFGLAGSRACVSTCAETVKGVDTQVRLL